MVKLDDKWRGVCAEVEWIPTKNRTLVGTVSSLFFTLGQMILAGVAYSLKDWRKLHVAVSAPFFIFFLYSWSGTLSSSYTNTCVFKDNLRKYFVFRWFLESARWLVLNGRTTEALQHLRHVARINGKTDVAEKMSLEVWSIFYLILNISQLTSTNTSTNVHLYR